MKRIAIVAGALWCAFAVGLWAQTVTQQTLSGNECWNAGQGPGGPSSFICVNLVRGSTPNAILSAVTGSLTIGSTSGNFTLTGSPTMAALADGGNVLVTAQPAAATWTWPANPIPDGAIVGVCNVTSAAWATNAQTPAANTGQTMNTTAVFTTLAAGTCLRYQWNLSQLTWYKVQ